MQYTFCPPSGMECGCQIAAVVLKTITYAIHLLKRGCATATKRGTHTKTTVPCCIDFFCDGICYPVTPRNWKASLASAHLWSFHRASMWRRWTWWTMRTHVAMTEAPVERCTTRTRMTWGGMARGSNVLTSNPGAASGSLLSMTLPLLLTIVFIF